MKMPFSVGDVVTLDCRPFMPLRHGVIISDDQSILDYVFCSYVKKDGSVTYGALESSDVFEGKTPRMSVLYNVKHYHGELPPEEAFMPELGVELAKLYQMNFKKYEGNCYALAGTYNSLFELFGDEPERLLRVARAMCSGDTQELEQIMLYEV